MTTTTTHDPAAADSSARDRITRAAGVLTGLLRDSAGLTAEYGTLTAGYVTLGVTGISIQPAGWDDDDDTSRRQVRAWARYLGAATAEAVYTSRRPKGAIETSTVISGVRVQVFAALNHARGPEDDVPAGDGQQGRAA